MPTRERRLQEQAKRQRRPRHPPAPEGEAMARKPDLYYARRPFGYTDDLYVDQGQVVELAGAINDEKLTRLGYFEKLTDGAARRARDECGECGAQLSQRPFPGPPRRPAAPQPGAGPGSLSGWCGRLLRRQRGRRGGAAAGAGSATLY